MRTLSWLTCSLLLALLTPGCKCSHAPGLAAAPSKAIPTALKGRFNVAFVYVGPVGDGGWTYAHDQGRKALEAELKVHTAYVENVTEGAEAEQVIRGLARKGFQVVVATSFGYMDAVETVAGEFPGVKFVHISGHKDNGRNFGNLFGAMETMKYLAGMIAGARAMADGQTKIGYIAPFPIPEVIRLGNALMLGIRHTCPACTMEIRWVNSWFDPTREREAADSLIKSGADVVVTGADTSGPIMAAKDAGKWAIGYDSENACNAAPDRCLTAPYWRWGPVYIDLVRRIQSGTWKGRAEYQGAQKGIVGLLGFMKGQQPARGVPATVVPEVKATLAAMQKGALTRFDIFKGPIRDNQGELVVKQGQRLTQKDLEGLPGCTVCMNWLAEGIVGQVPKRP